MKNPFLILAGFATLGLAVAMSFHAPSAQSPEHDADVVSAIRELPPIAAQNAAEPLALIDDQSPY